MDQMDGLSIVFYLTTACSNPYDLLYVEAHPVRQWKAYERNQAVVEEIISDQTYTCLGLCVVLLRYFDPFGANRSGDISEKRQRIPNNLVL